MSAVMSCHIGIVALRRYVAKAQYGKLYFAIYAEWPIISIFQILIYARVCSFFLLLLIVLKHVGFKFIFELASLHHKIS